jgi:hypothetical protein
MKRFSAIFLLVTLLVTLFSVPATANQTDYLVEDFTDLVNADGTEHWAYNQMRDLISMGILKGYDGGILWDEELGQTFQAQLALPDKRITRAEFAVLLYQTLNLTPQTPQGNFTDTIPNWASDAVNTLAAVGIVKGDPTGTFRPNDNISRAEIATMIVQSLNDKSEQEGKSFWDLPNKDSHWAYSFIEKASAIGIINGLPDGRFAPNRYARRADALTMLYNFLLKDKTQAPDDNVLLDRTEALLKIMEEGINRDGTTVDLSGVEPFVTGRSEATLADSVEYLEEMKKNVTVNYQVTYPGTVVSKSDRWAEVTYETLITVEADGQKLEQRVKEHYYLMKMGNDWYIYADDLEELEQ